jgi:hypothetical protein
LSGLVQAQPLEGRRIIAPGLNWYSGKMDLFCHGVALSPKGNRMLSAQ